jgi:hypothetical protein
MVRPYKSTSVTESAFAGKVFLAFSALSPTGAHLDRMRIAGGWGEERPRRRFIAREKHKKICLELRNEGCFPFVR